MAMAAVLAGSIAISGCGAVEPAAVEEKAPVPVEAVKVEKGVIEGRASLTGSLAPNDEVHVAPKISGTLAAFQVEVGERVNAGDVLFTLDEADLRTALDQAEAAYQSAAASLNQTQVSSDQGVVQAENGLQQAQQAYNDQTINLERTKELFAADFVSKQQMEQAETGFKNAEIALNNARKAVEVARRETGIAVAQASAQQARLSLEKARDDLAYAEVTAPISGVVSFTSGNAGSFVSPQGTVVTLIDTSMLLVKVNVSEAEVTGIQIGDAVDVTVPATGAQLKAVVKSVSPVMDAQAKAYPVEIAIENAGDQLKVDMVAEVRFQGDAGADASSLVIPRSAVIEEEGEAFVYKVEGTKAVKQPIQIGERNSDLVEVTGGVALGDQVVTRGITLLNDGDEVALQP